MRTTGPAVNQHTVSEAEGFPVGRSKEKHRNSSAFFAEPSRRKDSVKRLYSIQLRTH